MFHPRVALASLSGEADSAWALNASPFVGCAFLGGIAIDEPTRRAATEMASRDRSEFLPPDPFAFIDSELESLSAASIRPAYNVRSVTLGATRRAAAVCRRHDAVLELNAHCRQDEMCTVGAGEALLGDPHRLRAHVETASEAGARVSVKVRAGVAGVDLPSIARRLEDAGADCLHVDAMDSEAVVGDVAAASTLFLVANNGVRGRPSAREYFEYGADAVSVGRASDDPAVLRAVNAAATEWFTEEVAR